MKGSPCLNCEDRHDLCHSDCKKYISYRKELDDMKKKIRKESETESYLYNNAVKQKWKSNGGIQR